MSNQFIPNSFQVPNAFVDLVMGGLSRPAITCYLVIIRKTIGWHKEFDSISASQFMQFCGIKKADTVYLALAELERFDLVVSISQKGRPKKYKINLTPTPVNRVTPVNGVTPTPVNGVHKVTIKTNKNNSFVGDEKNGIADEEKPVAEPDSFVAAEAATQSPKVGNSKSKSARPTAENKKRFERIVDVYNRVFADCPMVSCVALTKVPNPKDGALEYTKVNQERLKLIPYAWEFAKLRLDGWKDDSGLIDGEQPSSKHVLMWFETYFAECLADGFINGSQPRSKAHENWKADFNYMMKRETLEKRVLEK